MSEHRSVWLCGPFGTPECQDWPKSSFVKSFELFTRAKSYFQIYTTGDCSVGDKIMLLSERKAEEPQVLQKKNLSDRML